MTTEQVEAALKRAHAFASGQPENVEVEQIIERVEAGEKDGVRTYRPGDQLFVIRRKSTEAEQPAR